jgi:hypothetical protein
VIGSRFIVLTEHLKMPNSGHFVDFYASDEQFIAAAADFLKEGFASGSSCIAVLTQEHFAAVRRLLGANGLDLQQLLDDYRFVSLDAVETLASFWRDNTLDMCGFYTKFADLIRLMSAGGKEVRIIGEIVGLLAQQGRLDAVIAIEDLCNDLSREHVFRMYCLYCENTFAQPLDEAARRRICATHSGSLRAA